MMRVHAALCTVAVLFAGGCGGGLKPYQPVSEADRKLFMPSVRRSGPEPVYARTRWVRAENVTPNREDRGGSVTFARSPSLRSVFHLSLKNVSLEEAARVLAATSRYSSFATPSIASERISVENLGTIDELGRIIERKANIKVVIDHDNREVRFLAPYAAQPQLFEE